MLALALVLVVTAQVDAGPSHAFAPLVIPVVHVVLEDIKDIEAGPGRTPAELFATLQGLPGLDECVLEPTGAVTATLVILADGSVRSVEERRETVANGCIANALTAARFGSSAVAEQRVVVKLEVVAGKKRKPIILGSLDKDVIRKHVQSKAKAIRACYEPALVQSPTLSGKVLMKWTISGAGTVVEVAAVEAPEGFADVTTCLRREIGGWVFPKTKGGGVVKVSYPFVFKSH